VYQDNVFNKEIGRTTIERSYYLSKGGNSTYYHSRSISSRYGEVTTEINTEYHQIKDVWLSSKQSPISRPIHQKPSLHLEVTVHGIKLLLGQLMEFC